MKPFASRFFGRLKNTGEDGLPSEKGDSRFFGPASGGLGDVPEPTSWSARARQVEAIAADPKAGMARLRELWGGDSIMTHLAGVSVERMLPYISFARVPGEREVILQDEVGDYLLVVLRGSVSVIRKQEWGEVLVLATVNAGEMLGEMSFLDGGVRFSTCITRSETEVAVISAHDLDRMIQKEPQIAASFVALLARKLSLRLRIVSARLGGRHT